MLLLYHVILYLHSRYIYTLRLLCFTSSEMTNWASHVISICHSHVYSATTAISSTSFVSKPLMEAVLYQLLCTSSHDHASWLGGFLNHKQQGQHTFSKNERRSPNLRIVGIPLRLKVLEERWGGWSSVKIEAFSAMFPKQCHATVDG